jgi:hypothetical protein
MTTQFRPKGGLGNVKPRVADGFRANYNNIYRVDPRIAMKAKEREGKCIGNENTCGARKAKGTDYCVGHMRSLGLLETKAEVTDDAGRTDRSDEGAD